MDNTLYKVLYNVTLMYKKASFFSGIVTMLSAGTYVDVISISNGWANCIYNNKNGYIQSSRLELVTGSVTIKYVNENNVSIAPDKFYGNLPIDTYSFNAPIITGYTLTSTSPISVTLSKTNLNPIITFKYKKNVVVVTGSVTIAYVDQDTNNKIANSDVYSNLSLGTYSYSAKTFEGYYLVSNETQSVTLTADAKNQIIIFYYRVLGSIAVIYLDIDTNSKIVENDIYIDMKLGSYTYSAKTFEGYMLVGDTTQTVVLTPSNSDQLIFFNYKIIGSVTVNYLNEDTNQIITPSEVYTNLILGTYTYDAKTFEGYMLYSNETESVTLTTTDKNKIVIFYYRIACSVTIAYIDEDNDVKLAENDVYSDLLLGSYTYDAKVFDGYTLVNSSPQNVTFTEATRNHVIIFNYKKIVIPVDETEIPYISIYYYNPKPTDAEDVIIPLYFTDFYQKEYYDDDYSLRFKLRYEVDGNVRYIKNLPAGDYNLNLGKLSEGMHWYSAQVEDIYGRVSRRIFNDLWVINEANYALKSDEIYTITDEDLSKYKINKNNSENEEAMINNRVGLSQIFEDLRGKGIRKIFLPLGIYRVNRCLRLGTIADKNCPIIIPSGLTVEMNGATFKLHPYDDRQYGDRARVENLIVRMNGGKDSHLINGIIEGDFFERQNLIWTDGSNAISGSNGEQNNGIYMYGCEFSSIDNVTIKQVTGYNLCMGQNGTYGWGKIGTWIDGKAIINGDEIDKVGYTTSNFCTMDSNLLANKYVVASVWLAMGGLKGKYWDMDFHFYDENYNFLETIKIYQFTRCRIPDGSKYLRMTFRCESEDIGSLSLHHMRVTRYCSVNNCHWFDNRTCFAPFQSHHLLIDRCDFTRSGESITPCEIDLEDGWEQQQDIFIRSCEILKNVGTADIIDNSGINHVMENCKNMSMTARYRINGITLRNNENIGVSISIGWMTGNTVRVYNNKINGAVLGQTELQFFNYQKTRVKIKDNNIILSYIDRGNEFYTFDKNIINFTGTSKNINILNSIVSYKGFNCYMNGNLYLNNCEINFAEGDTRSQFSFNQLNAERNYVDCIYNSPAELLSHNYFNSGKWDNCTFIDTLLIKTDKDNNMGDIMFTNCIFKKDITIDLKTNAKVQFNNCTFYGKIIFTNNGHLNSEFNDCTFNLT